MDIQATQRSSGAEAEQSSNVNATTSMAASTILSAVLPKVADATNTSSVTAAADDTTQTVDIVDMSPINIPVDGSNGTQNDSYDETTYSMTVTQVTV